MVLIGDLPRNQQIVHFIHARAREGCTGITERSTQHAFDDIIEYCDELLDGGYDRKFDALIAAVFAEDDATRDRILARAKALEAES